MIDTPTFPGVSSQSKSPALVAELIGAAAVIWFTTLSGWLGIAPGSVLVNRQNVLFNSDTNTWIGEMVENRAPSAAERAVHPLDVFFWRLPCRALAGGLRLVLQPERAGLLAARLLVALVAGTGVGLLAWLALRLGLDLPQCLLLFGMYLLFTSASTIALPEHFGLSNGLLSTAFVAPLLLTRRRTRAAVLLALAALCGGTTLTNVLFPLAGLYQWSLPSARARVAVVGGILLALPLAVFLFLDSRQVVLLYTDADKEIASRVAVLPRHVPGITRWYLKTTQVHGHVVDYLNLRLVRDPADAAAYAVFALVAPVVGPAPAVRTTKGARMVTYESGQPLHWNPNGYFTGSDGLRLSDYLAVQGVGGVVWFALFFGCAYRAFRDPQTRMLAWLPAGWIVFNVVFHNLWGDELFLYAPHWSWALMVLVVLGARGLSLAAIVAIVLPLAGCQIYSLFQIKNALLTIL